MDDSQKRLLSPTRFDIRTKPINHSSSLIAIAKSDLKRCFHRHSQRMQTKFLSSAMQQKQTRIIAAIHWTLIANLLSHRPTWDTRSQQVSDSYSECWRYSSSVSRYSNPISWLQHDCARRYLDGSSLAQASAINSTGESYPPFEFQVWWTSYAIHRVVWY